MKRSRIASVALAVAIGVAGAGAITLPASASTPSSCRTDQWIEEDSSAPGYLVGWKYLRSFYSTSAGYPQRYYVYQEARPVPLWPVGIQFRPVQDITKLCP